VIERQLDIATRDGNTTTFITHPEREGPHPVIVFLMDAPAIREELRDMARRIAAVGYYVMLPNLYYREGEMELGPIDQDPNSPMRKKMYDLMNTLSIRMVLDDVDGMLAFAGDDAAADASRVAVIGYCMSGRFALCAGAHRPKEVKATASLYGVKLVTDQPNSPHLQARDAPAEFYIACAETDHWAPLSMVEQMQKELAGPHGEVELYPGVEHGFAFPKRHCFNKPAAERH
jgi:carboxymethylenebutenolidase